MALSDVKNWLNKQRASIQENIARYKNKDFLDAVVAGCALVAAADGKIDASEKQKMVEFIQRSEELKIFDIKEVIQRFTLFTDGFEFDHSIGTGEAMKAIGKIKPNPEASRLLIQVFCTIGMADGSFDDNEKKVVKNICVELKLDPNEFQL